MRLVAIILIVLAIPLNARVAKSAACSLRVAACCGTDCVANAPQSNQMTCRATPAAPDAALAQSHDKLDLGAIAQRPVNGFYPVASAARPVVLQGPSAPVSILPIDRLCSLQI